MTPESSYRPKVGAMVSLPPLTGRRLTGSPWAVDGPTVLVASFSPKAIGEMTIWRKLLESRGSAFTFAIFRPQWSERQIEEAEALFAPSLHASVVLAVDDQDQWQSLLEPDRLERAFAAVIEGDTAQILVVGSPTEEAWDIFQQFLPAD